MKYYSASKRKEIVIYATMWMNLEDIMLSDISQSQKDKYCMIHLEMTGVVKFTDREKGSCQELGKGEWGISA